MELKELRKLLSRYTSDILAAFSRARLGPLHSGFPHDSDVTRQVTFLMEVMERKVRLKELEAFAFDLPYMVREVLLQGFAANDIYRFMYDSAEFKQVVLGIGYGHSKTAYIDPLIEHCDQYPEKYEVVLNWMRQENPSRYTAMFLTW